MPPTLASYYRSRLMAYIVAIWVLQALVSAALTFANYKFLDLPISAGVTARVWLLGGAIWAAFTPVAIWLARRYPVRRPWWRPVQLHLAIGAATVLAYPAVFAALHQLLFGGPGESWFPLGLYLSLLAGNTDHMLRNYWIIVAMVHLFDAYAEARRRALAESRLETRLAQAEFRALQMQLHPHFLFNALNSVSVLMRRDVEQADRSLTRLARLLRATLAGPGEAEVPLAQEIGFLREYLELEQVRFHDRLTTGIDVDPGAGLALVPRFILQPLVENAVKHGVAHRESGARLQVRAARDGAALRLEVEDNGPGERGAAAKPAAAEVGLANVRGRLELLYGPRGTLDARPLAGGGFRATIRLPYRTDAPGVAPCQA